ncbi:MAG TPA: glycosyltransferase family 4 protein [Nitrososphaerales archaeon]|nr:glycosyltransferase family 4 protein [Nitrososphaerales archaeon]
MWKVSKITFDMQAAARQLRRVVYVAPDVPIPFPSGASVHVSELAEHLTAAGHEVHVVARRVRRTDRAFERLGGVTFHRVYRLILFGQPRRSRPGGGRSGERTGLSGRLYYAYLATVFALYVSLFVSRLVKRNRIDVIFERETSFGAGGLASLFTSRPLILEIIGPRYSGISAKRSSKILYYTESMLKEWVERSKCVPVSAGVNLELFRNNRELGAATRKSLGLADSDKVVGYVGSFQDWHGVDTLLLATKRMRDRAKSVKLILVGPYTEEYIEMSKRLGVFEYCTFVGPVGYEEVPSFINACDIMVAPYNPNADPLRKAYGIGSPLKLFEYMACEKPIISTKVDPIQEIPSVGEAGILIEPGEPEVLSMTIVELAEDEGARSRMGRHGRRLVENGFSWGPLAERVSSMIQAA